MSKSPHIRPTVHATRERTALRSLLRFAGITPAAAAVGRGLVGSRDRSTATVGTLGTAVVAVVALALFVPAARPVFSTIVQAPADIVQQVVPGASEQTSGDKPYPRLYSLRLGVDVNVEPGDGKTPPVKPIAYQYPDTAALGAPGNTYLYAHDRPGMFLGLHRAQVGDVLVLALSPSDRRYYQVTEIHQSVAWNDLEWLRPTTDARLTLQTCNLSGDYDPRFIVVTKEIPADQGAALTSSA